jgi:hypothetical protein
MLSRTLSGNLLTVFISGVFLIGCEQNQSNKTSATQTIAQKYETATVLHGTVSDENGYIETGIVIAANSQTSITSSSFKDKHYSIEIPAQTALPITLSYQNENSEQKLRVAVIHPSITKYDINPLTTVIARKATELGGFTDSNLRQAAETVSSMSDHGKATAGAHGNPTQRYGGWH